MCEATYCHVGLRSARLVSLRMERLSPLDLPKPKLPLGYVLPSHSFAVFNLIIVHCQLPPLDFSMYSHTYGVETCREPCTEITHVPDLLPSRMYSSLTRETEPRRKVKDNALNITELLPCMRASHVMYFTQPVPTHDFCTGTQSAPPAVVEDEQKSCVFMAHQHQLPMLPMKNETAFQTCEFRAGHVIHSAETRGNSQGEKNAREHVRDLDGHTLEE